MQGRAKARHFQAGATQSVALGSLLQALRACFTLASGFYSQWGLIPRRRGASAACDSAAGRFITDLEFRDKQAVGLPRNSQAQRGALGRLLRGNAQALCSQ
jgi:hypothetical protein